MNGFFAKLDFSFTLSHAFGWWETVMVRQAYHEQFFLCLGFAGSLIKK